MALKQYLDETVPEFKTGRLNNTKEAYEHEYDAAFEYYKGFGFTDEDRQELKDRGFDLNQETVWKSILEGKENADILQETKKWRFSTLKPLKECSMEIQNHCSDHIEYAFLGCYFRPDIAELDEICGLDNLRMVVANHVRIHTGPKDKRSLDGRYDEKVRTWAWTVPGIPVSPRSEPNRPLYEIGLGDLHSTLCDSLARKVMEYEAELTLKQPAQTPKTKAKSR